MELTFKTRVHGMPNSFSRVTGPPNPGQKLSGLMLGRLTGGRHRALAGMSLGLSFDLKDRAERGQCFTLRTRTGAGPNPWAREECIQPAGVKGDGCEKTSVTAV